MMTSERKELVDKLNEAIKEQENIKYSVLSFVNGVVNRAEYLTNEQKQAILEEVWKGE